MTHRVTDNAGSAAALPDVERVVGFLEEAQSALFVTGAGVSADSGLPTYRGVGGLYDADTTEDGLPIERILSGYTMRNSPRLTWKYIHRIESACRGSTYNRAHEILAELEACIPRVWIFTQNVDGFHRAAGSKNLVDIHGDIHDLVCTRCTARERVEDFEHLPPLPRCSSCGAIVRPDVVLFDEYLSEDKVDVLYRELDRGFDIIFTVGTSSMFAYITDPIWVARRCGTPSVEIDPGLTEVSDLVDIKIPLPATYTLEMIWQIYSRRQSGE